MGDYWRKQQDYFWYISYEKKITSGAWLETSGLNDIFHWYAHWEIFDESSLSLFEEFKWSLTIDKIDASLAKSLGLESDFSCKWYMYTKNR